MIQGLPISILRQAASNPKILGPLLISTVGAQRADEILNALSNNQIPFDDVLNILVGSPISSVVNQMGSVDTPDGVYLGPTQEDLDRARKESEILNKPISTPIPEEKKVTVDDIGFTQVEQDYEPIITLPPEFKLDQGGFTPLPDVKPSDYIMTAEETKGGKKEELKPNEKIFNQIAGVKNHTVERDPNDLFLEGWEKMIFPSPKQIGSIGNYAVAIDPMKRSDNNFLLVKDGKVHATLELATAMGQDKVLELDAIGVPAEMQGQGIAKDVLNELFKLADANGVTIQGVAQPFGNKALNKKQLISFYKNMGFEVRGDEITRKPVIAEEKSSLVPPIDFSVIPENTPISVKPVPKKVAVDKGLSENEGVYMANVDGQNVDLKNKTFNTANISVTPEGIPKFDVQNAINRDIEKVPGSKLTKVNLFKKSAGWKWLDKPEGGNDSFLVSVEQGGKHYYTLDTNMTADTQLKYYPNEKSEPRLRPTAYDDLVLGNKVGEIDVRGKKHPVYDSIEVSSPKQAVGADVTPKTVYSPQDSILKDEIRPVLTKDLLKPQYLNKLKEDDDISCGQCYAASEAAFHMYGKDNGFKSYVLNSKTFPEGLDEGDTHWFLKNKEGEIIDPTAEQFGDITIPYDKGKGTGFLTKNPSNAAQQIIDRVNQNNAQILSGADFISQDIKITGSGKNNKILVNDILTFLDKGKKRDLYNPEDFKAAVNEAVSEIEYQLAQDITGKGWYDEDIEKSMGILEKINPKVIEDPLLKELSLFLTGISSAMTPVGGDFKIAIQMINNFTETGILPSTNPVTGKQWNRNTNLKRQIDFAQKLIDQKGLEGFMSFLFDPISRREINTLRKELANLGPIDPKLDIKSGETIGIDDKNMFGTDAFGPKLGPFLANLHGQSDNNVIDIWNVRGMNRRFGNMFIRDQEGNVLTNKEGNIMVADQPRSQKERAQFIRFMNEVASLTNLSVRDAQAILWYYEQGLYTKLGVPSEPKKYSEVAEKFLEEQSNVSQGSLSSSDGIKNKINVPKKKQGGYVVPLPKIDML